MTALPPFLILLDLNTLTIDNPRLWQEFSRVGDCFVPKVVLEEIQTLCNHAPEPAIEQSAREFVRFFPNSGWKSTASIATHPALQPAEGHELSKKARLILAIAQAAYGLSRNRPEALIVVVTHERSLMQRIRALNTSNICSIPVTVLVQWSRSQRKPPVVLNQLQAMRSTVGAAATPVAATANTRSMPTPATVRPLTTAPKRAPAQQTRKRLIRPLYIFYNLLTLVIVVIAGLAIWRMIHPPSFAKFWQQLPLPEQPLDPKLNPLRK